MKKTRFSLQENFPDDGSKAAEIYRKLNFGEANKPCFFSVNSNTQIPILFYVLSSKIYISMNLN
jgi:hypothetical protein